MAIPIFKAIFFNRPAIYSSIFHTHSIFTIYYDSNCRIRNILNWFMNC